MGIKRVCARTEKHQRNRDEDNGNGYVGSTNSSVIAENHEKKDKP
jgi:hypothetical protein